MTRDPSNLDCANMARSLIADIYASILYSEYLDPQTVQGSPTDVTHNVAVRWRFCQIKVGQQPSKVRISLSTYEMDFKSICSLSVHMDGLPCTVSLMCVICPTAQELRLPCSAQRGGVADRRRPHRSQGGVVYVWL